MQIVDCGEDDRNKIFLAHDSAMNIRGIEQYEEHLVNIMGILLCHKGLWPAVEKYKVIQRGVYLLDAHGKIEDNFWLFEKDPGQFVPVQEWVNEHDGKTGLLIICVCNPYNRGRLTAHQSLVIHPISSLRFSSMTGVGKKSKMAVLIPGEGYFVTGKKFEEFVQRARFGQILLS